MSGELRMLKRQLGIHSVLDTRSLGNTIPGTLFIGKRLPIQQKAVLTLSTAFL